MSHPCPQCGRLHSEFDPRCLECGTPLPTTTLASPTPTSFTAGGRLGRFEILGEIGRGGMGVVYRGRDLELGREVALKLLAGSLDRETADRTRALREARAVAALDHPAIGTLYEVGTDPAGSFLVLALYEGRTLAAELAERGSLPPLEVVEILRQLAGALAAAHAAGVLHRDVKPSNVFRLPDGRIKLLDFGIARSPALSYDASSSGGEGLVGTATYMSPERLRGDTSGGAADLWSLGIVGWELATGRHPFALDRPAWLERVMAGAPAAAPWPPGLEPAGLASLLLACLSRDSEARPTAAALETELAALLAVARQPARDPGEPALAAAAAKSRRRRVVALAALAGAALSVAAIAWWPRPVRPRVVTVLEPRVEGQLAAGDRDRLAANLEATSWRTLLRLEGVEAVDRSLARQAKGEPTAVARATAADETVGWEASCQGVDLCSVRLLRRDAAGRVLGSESLELSASGDTLSARAAAAALRRVYPELRAKDGKEEKEPDARVYQGYLELRTALDRRRISFEAALEELVALRGEAPALLELNALEAGICRFLLARDRDPKWLARGLEAARAGLALAPEDAVLLGTRFDLLLESKQLAEAAGALSALEGSSAGLADVLIRRARLAEAQGRPEEALVLLTRLAQDRPAAHFLLTLANLEQRLGRTADARRHLVLALERAPQNAQAGAQLAGLDLAEGRLAEATEGWRRLATAAPALDSLDNYGLALLLSRRYQEAEAVFRQALALREDHAETQVNLADTLSLLGRRQEAFVLYRRLVAAAPDPAVTGWQLWATRAQAHAQLGEPAEARAALAEVLRRAPQSGEAAVSAALVLTLLGDAPAALAEARRATAAGAGGIWFELPFFDPLASELEAAGIRRAKVPPQG